ncbi:AP1M2 protein, partial [Zosterops hypoxanthus]|nr:AP1M2 protein [Zosterops hypoxanthus]
CAPICDPPVPPQPLISRSYKGDVGLGDIEPFMGVLLQREEEGTLSPVLRHGPLHFLWIKHNNLYWRGIGGGSDGDEAEDEDEAEDDEAEDKDKAEDEDEDDEAEDEDDEVEDKDEDEDDEDKAEDEVEDDEDEDDEDEAGAEDEDDEAEDDDEDEAAEPCRPQVSANGSVVLSEVVGTIKLKVFLSGMPELRLGLNDRVLFELTGRECGTGAGPGSPGSPGSPRCPEPSDPLCPLTLLSPLTLVSPGSSVSPGSPFNPLPCAPQAKGQFKKQSVASGVEISVPVPSDADSPKFKSTVGTARYLPERNVLVWSIKSFPGGKEHLLRAHFGLPSVEKEEEEGRPPIAVRFEIPYFTVSGIQV